MKKLTSRFSRLTNKAKSMLFMMAFVCSVAAAIGIISLADSRLEQNRIQEEPEKKTHEVKEVLTAAPQTEEEEESSPIQIAPALSEISLTIGETKKAEVAVSPAEASQNPLKWMSAGSLIATVNELGEITGTGRGTTVIIVSLAEDPEVYASIKIIVAPAPEPEPVPEPAPVEAQAQDAKPEAQAAKPETKAAAPKTTAVPKAEPVAEAAVAEPEPAPEPAPAGNYNDSYANQVLSILNDERAKAGLAPLSMNSGAVSAAKTRAAEIVTSFSHTRPDGRKFYTAITSVSYSKAGENIAYGQQDPASVMAAWMASDGHRANILDGGFTQIGIACYYYNSVYYWAQIFIG